MDAEISARFVLTPEMHETPFLASQASAERKHYVYLITHNGVKRREAKQA
jgi:hypothetical protein